ncbi:GNAT family acetyltransferase [Pseudactinotalea sp. Z1739]|uniref:GNAT family acetyltransferase n=1 Tax=Pseudactinotalea sp. Z1739 TaxID=3413028 RepID=UPI003C7CD603
MSAPGGNPAGLGPAGGGSSGVGPGAPGVTSGGSAGTARGSDVMPDGDAGSGGVHLPQVRVTEADRSDAAEVIALWHRAGLTRPWNHPGSDFHQASTSPVSTVLIARLPRPAVIEQHRVAGTPEASPQHGDIVTTAMVGVDGHRGWIYYFATDPRMRGRGYGSQMLTACEEWLAGHGARKVQLMVRQDNPVASFYARHGYTDQSVTVLGRWLTGESKDPLALRASERGTSTP